MPMIQRRRKLLTIWKRMIDTSRVICSNWSIRSICSLLLRRPLFWIFVLGSVLLLRACLVVACLRRALRDSRLQEFMYMYAEILVQSVLYVRLMSLPLRWPVLRNETAVLNWMYRDFSRIHTKHNKSAGGANVRTSSLWSFTRPTRTRTSTSTCTLCRRMNDCAGLVNSRRS